MYRMLAVILLVNAPAFAQPMLQPMLVSDGVAGEWTKCIAWSGGRQWNIVYAQSSSSQCYELAKKCTADANVTTTFYSSPVIVNAPYTRCTAAL